MKYPSEVDANIRFLKSKKIWHIVSENPKVVSCGDAASKRNRLGHIGIPIFDELKSELGYFINKDKQRQKVLVHCRGNQKLDRLKISGILNSEYQRITNSDESKGLINPFGKNFRNLLQIFDISTTKKFHPPYSMMTNVGDFNYGVEFEVESLISQLKFVKVEDVIRNDNYNQFKKHKIGILTGNGPDSGILLWKLINENVKSLLASKLFHSFRGDFSFPEVIIESIPDMGISMELNLRTYATKNAVIKSIISLCQNGATLICIACNTTQYFKNEVAEICQLYGANFIAIPELVEEYLNLKELKEFDFIGISHVTDFENFSAFKELKFKYKVIVPETKIVEKINSIAFETKKNISKSANLLKDLIQFHTKTSCTVIALTEFSTILSHNPKLIKDKVIIDTLQILAERLAEIYVNGIFDTLYVDVEKDTIEYIHLDKKIKPKAKSEIWNILCEIDYEFVPPLSYRDSTTFEFNSETIESSKPMAYFDQMFEQEIIVSRKKNNGQITGFMSFIPNHTIEHDLLKIPCCYITTIGVTKGERGNGVTNQFYSRIEKFIKSNNYSKTVATRTWSTNKTHIRILLNLGYKEIIHIDNDRGNGIHTVYFAKDLTIHV